MEPITGSWVTILLAITLFAIIIGLYFKGQDKRAIEARTMFGIAAIFGAIALFSWIGWVPGLDIQTAAPPGTTIDIPADAGITTVISTDEQKLISSLSIMTIDAGSNKRNVCEDQVQYFAEGEDPRLSTAYSIDTTTIASGVGTENGSYLKTNTLYKTIFHDTSGPSYYDGVLGEGVWNPSDAISAVAIKAPSTTAATVTTSITFGEDGTAPLWKIATIPDMLDETATDGTINGQSNINGSVECNGEIQVGADATPANGNTVYYNDTNGDGSFYLRLTFGSEGSQAYLKRPVVCFVNDMSNPCERNEFSAITAALYTGSGSDVVLPSDLHTAFSNMNACVEIGGQEIDGVAYIASGKTAVYTVTFTVAEEYTDGSADLFYMFADDLADYLGQDIRSGQGATGTSVTIGFRA